MHTSSPRNWSTLRFCSSSVSICFSAILPAISTAFSPALAPICAATGLTRFSSPLFSFLITKLKKKNKLILFKFNSRNSFRVYQFSEIIRGRELSPRVLTFILTLNSWPRLLVNIIFVAHCLLIGYPLGISRYGPARKCPFLAI